MPPASSDEASPNPAPARHSLSSSAIAPGPATVDDVVSSARRAASSPHANSVEIIAAPTAIVRQDVLTRRRLTQPRPDGARGQPPDAAGASDTRPHAGGSEHDARV